MTPMDLFFMAIFGTIVVLCLCSIAFGNFDDRAKEKQMESLERAERGVNIQLAEQIRREKYGKWTKLQTEFKAIVEHECYGRWADLANELKDIAGQEPVFHAPDFNELTLA